VETSPNDPAAGLARRSIEHLLRDLNELRRRLSDASSRPLLTLHLRGGTPVEGWLLDFGPDEERREPDPVALVRPRSADGRSREDVMFVPLPEIQAVTVHEAPEFGKHFRPAPTRLGVRRLAEEAAQELSKQTGRKVDVDFSVEKVPESSLQTLSDNLTVLKTTLRDLAADPVGKKVFREGVRTLAIKRGALEVAPVKAGTLTVTLPGDAGLSSEALKAAIEQAL